MKTNRRISKYIDQFFKNTSKKQKQIIEETYSAGFAQGEVAGYNRALVDSAKVIDRYKDADIKRMASAKSENNLFLKLITALRTETSTVIKKLKKNNNGLR